MKQIMFALIMCIFISLNCIAQKQDSVKADTSKKIPVFAVILRQDELMNLIEMLKTADVKPTELKDELNLVYGRIQLMADPAQQNPPQKTTGKK